MPFATGRIGKSSADLSSGADFLQMAFSEELFGVQAPKVGPETVPGGVMLFVLARVSMEAASH